MVCFDIICVLMSYHWHGGLEIEKLGKIHSKHEQNIVYHNMLS